MVAQEWAGRHLSSSVYFEPDEQGLDLFASYLRSFRSEPIRLLVDLIEEEFRQITIPLLRGSDRKAILARNYAKFFRNSVYKFAISQSVEKKKKRKEEKLLIIGLTNQFLLEPWLKIIDQTRTPLTGIISLPLLSEDYVKNLKSDSKAVILVSQQVPSNLRQSVFVDGKLVLSRLVPIASFYQGDYAHDVMRDIESTQRYLISQRIVERAETVSIHIITNKRHFEKLIAHTENDNYFDIKIHEINDLLDNEKIVIPDEQDFSSGIYCYLASKKLATNHYALPAERRYFQHHKAGLALKFISIGLIAVGIGLAATNGIKGWLYHNTTIETQFIEQKYQAKYNQLSENLVDSTTSTTSMKNVVQTVAEIEKKYQVDPVQMLALISNDISLFPDIRVRDIDWFITNNSGSETKESVVWGKAVKKKKRNRNDPKPKLVSKAGFFEIATVRAEFLDFSGDFRYALSALDDLEKTMAESGKYFAVAVLKRPLDIESNNRLDGEVGASAVAQNVTAEFVFRVVREVPVND